MWLCVFYHGAFHVEFCLALCSRVLFSPFRIVITDRTGLCASRAFVFLHAFNFFHFSLPLARDQGLAAACDCGTPWTFLFTFFNICPCHESEMEL